MEQTFNYRVYPTEDVAREARRHINICREVYNHALGLYDSAPNDDKPTYTQLQNKLPTGTDANDDSSFRVLPAKRVCRGNLDRLSDESDNVVETGSHGSPDPW